MTPNRNIVIVCNAPGCHIEASPDEVKKHIGTGRLFVCPRCRSKNVKVIAVVAPAGTTLGAMSMSATGKGQS